MITTGALIVAVAAVLGVCGYLWWAQLSENRPDRVIRAQVKTQAVVTMIDGDSFQGVLDTADHRTIALIDATQITEPQQPAIPVDGRLLLPRDRVAYIQKI